MFSLQVENLLKRNKIGKLKGMKKNDTTHTGLMNKKLKISGDGVKASVLTFFFFASCFEFIPFSLYF